MADTIHLEATGQTTGTMISVTNQMEVRLKKVLVMTLLVLPYSTDIVLTFSHDQRILIMEASGKFKSLVGHSRVKLGQGRMKTYKALNWKSKK